MIALDFVVVKNSCSDGGERRIRTSVARKERQIYSLLPLTTRPPVQLYSKDLLTLARRRGAEPLNSDLTRSTQASATALKCHAAFNYAETSICSICGVGSGTTSPWSRMPSMWNSIASRMS